MPPYFANASISTLARSATLGEEEPIDQQFPFKARNRLGQLHPRLAADPRSGRKDVVERAGWTSGPRRIPRTPSPRVRVPTRPPSPGRRLVQHSDLVLGHGP